MPGPYDAGDLVRVSGTFTDLGGSPIDPGAVFMTFRFGNGVDTSYEFGTDAQLVKDGTGEYHVDIDTTNQGGKVCYYRFFSTGAGQAAEEDSFRVESSKFG